MVDWRALQSGGANPQSLLLSNHLLLSSSRRLVASFELRGNPHL